MKSVFQFLFITLFSCSVLNAQQFLNDSIAIPLLKQHIKTLASDKFEGRETGSNGEKLAYQYIIKQYRAVDLVPLDNDNYLQAFPFLLNYEVGKNNALTIDSKKYKLNTDFIPLPYYYNANVSALTVNVSYGISAPKIEYDDYSKITSDLKGKIFIIEYASPEGDNPHSKFANYDDLETKISTAKDKGAVAVLFINTNKEVKDPVADYHKRIGKELLPTFFVKGNAAKALIDNPNKNVSLTFELNKNEGVGHNVIGYLNNNSKNTVVITAHYDHLGFGDEGSLYRGKRKIHNGADDNASGTAAIIEIARFLKTSDLKNNNYLFIAFSGEEKGLLGSNYYVKHPLQPLEQINYNINLDMVGRLKTDDPVLIINGVGTSTYWKDALSSSTILKTKTSESGVGPSDQTSFYLENIPAIHFFSGTHEDYHKPSDDEDKINYEGEVKIINYILDVVYQLNDKGKLPFVKTNDSENEDRPRFKVTLGVIPDYAFEGEGLRIDGVSEGKPAATAGLKKGDIVLQIDDEKVTNMTTYMKALGMFSKGDKATVKVKRGDEIVAKEVVF